MTEHDALDDFNPELLLSRTREGFIGRRAHRLVHFIETNVLYHKDQVRWAGRVLLGHDETPWKAQDLLSGFATHWGEGQRIDAEDLERHAQEWSRLVPHSPRMRAAVMHILARKYGLSYDRVPKIRRALALDTQEVHEAYQREYGTAIETMSQGVAVTKAPPSADEPAEEDLLAQDAEWRFVAGGEAVTTKGEPMDFLYVVASGCLRVDPTASVPGTRREYGTGDILGDAAIFAAVPWPATVHAARDSELVCISREALERLLEAHPRQGLKLSRALMVRTAAGGSQTRRSTLTIAVLPLDDGMPEFAERLAEIMSEQGPTLRLDRRQVDDAVTAGASDAQPGDDLDGMVASWLSEKEANHRFVLYQADLDQTPWTDRCLRQADRVVLVAGAGSDPSPRPVEARLNARAEVHLVLLHPEGTQQPTETARWLSRRALRFHHHVRTHVATDMRRVARLISGDSVGLVLGGGGARGFVHAGVMQALEERGIHPHVLGGTSMGAVGAGLAALGWTPERILGLGERLGRRRALFDYTLPFLALTTGRKLNAFLQSIFGDARIEDLWRPFFCISANLTKGGQMIHRDGLLWEAVRASIAIPGIFSPVLHDGDVLVDGSVLNNVPADVMRDLCPGGTVIGVQVSPPSGGFGKYTYEPALSGWRLLWRRLNPLRTNFDVPSIVSLLMRSVELKDTASAPHEPSEMQADILIQPDTSSMRLLDFSAYRELGAIGYRTAKQVLERHPSIG